MISNQLSPREYNIYYKNYIDIATSLNIIEGLKQNLDAIVSFYLDLPQEKHEYAYAEEVDD